MRQPAARLGAKAGACRGRPVGGVTDTVGGTTGNLLGGGEKKV